MARYCKCRIDQLPYSSDEENIMESQATGIAPRILMPRNTFIEAAGKYDIKYGRENWEAIYGLADLFDVSKQSVMIRLEECNLL
jgi:Zn-dependent peptidase ImmA (M78 family)